MEWVNSIEEWETSTIATIQDCSINPHFSKLSISNNSAEIKSKAGKKKKRWGAIVSTDSGWCFGRVLLKQPNHHRQMLHTWFVSVIQTNATPFLKTL